MKAVDFEAGAQDRRASPTLLVEETLRDPGAVEVGHARRRCAGPSASRRRPAADGQPGLALGPDTRLRRHRRGRQHRLGDHRRPRRGLGRRRSTCSTSSPSPTRPTPTSRASRTDRDGLKRDLFERLQGARASGPRPRWSSASWPALERAARGARRDRAPCGAAGGTAHYHSVDLRDADGRRAGHRRRCAQRSGRVDVLLHAAGLEISRFLPDKAAAEFDLVFDVKGDGWFNLLHALGDMPLGATVVFSSIAGRFGNGGQTDYSAANDLLCKAISSFRDARGRRRAASPSTGRPGPTSAWRPAARSRR